MRSVLVCVRARALRRAGRYMMGPRRLARANASITSFAKLSNSMSSRSTVGSVGCSQSKRSQQIRKRSSNYASTMVMSRGSLPAPSIFTAAAIEKTRPAQGAAFWRLIEQGPKAGPFKWSSLAGTKCGLGTSSAVCRSSGCPASHLCRQRPWPRAAIQTSGQVCRNCSRGFGIGQQTICGTAVLYRWI